MKDNRYCPLNSISCSTQPAGVQHECCSPGQTREYFANNFFSMTFWWKNSLIQQISLGPGSDYSFSGRNLEPYSRYAATAMESYRKSKPVLWPNPPLDWSIVGSAFQNKVLLTLMKHIPFGQTVSYGRLAELSGSPGAARAVGRAMSENPWPVIVPCHRVLTARGTIGGFSSGTDLKKTLLRLEGRLFTGNGCQSPG